MKYFTKEELEDITKELVENPTRETLNNLNNKYNAAIKLEPSATDIPKVESSITETTLQTTEEVVMPLSSISVPTNTEPEIPSVELPMLEVPTEGLKNNKPINFTGDLFGAQPPVANLMQTTDNFNFAPNTMPSTEVPVTGTPFFGPPVTSENNPIPIGVPSNNMAASQPSMFGQLEQGVM